MCQSIINFQAVFNVIAACLAQIGFRKVWSGFGGGEVLGDIKEYLALCILTDCQVHTWTLSSVFQRQAYITSPAQVSSKTGNLLFQLVETTVTFKRADLKRHPSDVENHQVLSSLRCSKNSRPSVPPNTLAPPSPWPACLLMTPYLDLISAVFLLRERRVSGPNVTV